MAPNIKKIPRSGLSFEYPVLPRGGGVIVIYLQDMYLLVPKFLSLQSITPVNLYRKLDGWLLCGYRWRVKSRKGKLLVKRKSTTDWQSLQIVGRQRDFICPWCGTRTPILYYVTDYRCRACTKHVIPKRESILGQLTADRQYDLGDMETIATWISSTDDKRIASRTILEERGVLPPLLSRVTEEEAMSRVSYEYIQEPRVVLQPIKQGRIVWSEGRYIWVTG
jgi:hypothetical protein